MNKDKEAEGEGEVNWLDLPFHLMSLILLKLVYIKDYIHFGAVCQSWYSIYKQNLDDYTLHLPRQLPILLVTTEPRPEPRPDYYDYHPWQTHSFFDLSENRVCEFPLPVPHFDFYDGFCSSQGWLIHDTLDEVLLFNPFLIEDNAIKVIKLPNLEDENDRNIAIRIKKAVLSASPTSNPNYIIMASCRCNGTWKAASYKPGNRGWTSILDYIDCFPVDIIYYGNQFYAMDGDGSIWAFDLSSSIPSVSKFAPCIFEPFGPYLECDRINYFIESCGEFLGIKRNGNPNDASQTLNFQIFKLDQNDMKWNETKSLCGRSLFVGGNTSISILASDFPRCKPNCIYFTDRGYDEYDWTPKDKPHDMGVYNLEDGTIESFYPAKSFKHTHPAPIWVEPRLSK